MPQPLTLPNNPIISNLFRAIDQRNPTAAITRGSLILFNYTSWVHDPYPLILVSDVTPGKQLRGVNIHYLSFPFVKNLLQTMATPFFNYKNIKGNKIITNAFRTYKWNGIRTIKKMDINFILTIMATARSFDPNQIKAIRESVQEQIRRIVNPPAVPGPVTQNTITPTI